MSESSTVSAISREIWYQLRLVASEPRHVILSVAMPIGLFAFVTWMTADLDGRLNQLLDVRTSVTPATDTYYVTVKESAGVGGALALAVALSAMFLAALRMSDARAAGSLLGATAAGVPPRVQILGHVVTGAVIGTVVCLGCAVPASGWPALSITDNYLLKTIAAGGLTSLCFSAIGVAIGLAARRTETIVVSMVVVFIVLGVASGLLIPEQLLPSSLTRIGNMTPLASSGLLFDRGLRIVPASGTGSSLSGLLTMVTWTTGSLLVVIGCSSRHQWIRFALQ